MPGKICMSKVENHAPRFKAVNDHLPVIFGSQTEESELHPFTS